MNEDRNLTRTVVLIEIKNLNGAIVWRRVAFYIEDARKWLVSFARHMGWLAYDYTHCDGVIDTGKEFLTYQFTVINIV